MTPPVSSSPAQSRRVVWSWAFYDWANSAFATTVLAGFFPVFYAKFWREGVAATQTTTELGFASAIASVLVAIMSPVLGAIADVGGQRHRFLLVFTLLGVLATGALGLLGQPAWAIALGAFMLASIGFNGALVFYDAMLVDIAPPEKYDRVSSLGFALGYLGGGLLFAVNVLMLVKHKELGFSATSGAVQASFLMVAVWWMLFAIPLLTGAPKVSGPKVSLAAAAAGGIRQLIGTIRELPRYRNAMIFIVAYVIYIDGVNTVIRMATKFGSDLGIDAPALMAALLLTQFVAFPAALGFGRLGQWIGPRKAILIGLCVYAIATIGASFMQNATHFFMLAGVVGLVQGGVQALSRSLFARLIPADKSAEFFGFYNMLGKAAAILGPTLMALTALFVTEVRYTILSLPLLFILGGVVLLTVKDESAREA